MRNIDKFMATRSEDVASIAITVVGDTTILFPIRNQNTIVLW